MEHDSIPLHRRLELISLRPDAARAEIERLCREATAHSCLAVCVPGSRVDLATSFLEDSPVKVAALVGFPFGNADADVKRYEIEAALDAGAQEFDVVLDHGRIKDGDDKALLRELRDWREAAEERPLKAILELTLLHGEDLERAANLILEAELQFLVTATGCAARATTVADIIRLRELVGPDLGIKAVGAITTHADAQALVAAGANRIGAFQASSVLAP